MGGKVVICHSSVLCRSLSSYHEYTYTHIGMAHPGPEIHTDVGASGWKEGGEEGREGGVACV